MLFNETIRPWDSHFDNILSVSLAKSETGSKLL